MHLLTKKSIGFLCSLTLTLNLGLTPFPTLAEVPAQPSTEPAPISDEPVTERVYGNTLYDTALEISKKGWESAPTVVLATGRNFPDALAGSVLAKRYNGPLLLTETNIIKQEILDELKRLGTQKVFILGGTAVVSAEVEKKLKEIVPETQRLFGVDQFGTAAEISKVATPSSTKAFLVNGYRFPDALSISSYAAANGIPLLMTEPKKIPEATLKALDQLGVQEVTFVGGTAVIGEEIKKQLETRERPIKVTERLAGYDQYETNIKVLKNYNYNLDNIYVATGENFPDALAGAALAAKKNQPVLLIQKGIEKLAAYTTDYLTEKRLTGSSFTILGGWAVVNYKLENVIRTGVSRPRISLQYTQGVYSGTKGMLEQVKAIPTPATDYADIIAPSWYYLDDTADGSVSSTWDEKPTDYTDFVRYVHSRNLKVLPTISSSWSTTATADTVLSSPELRKKLIDNLDKRISTVGADGIVIDLEYLGDTMAPNLTAFMKELYARLHPQNKLVIIAVMSRTGKETWYEEFDYKALSDAVDYMHIMTYDYNTKTPGPLAPIDWITKILEYTKSQKVEMHKVLLGVPYYGTDWWKTTTETTWSSRHRGLNIMYGPDPTKESDDIDGALDRLFIYKATLQRDASKVPYFTYKDDFGDHIVYYDDAISWNEKMNLLTTYGLGGVGAWSLFWTIHPDTVKELYPVLKNHLR